MSKRMLIDATHAEETRVTVVNGNRLEEFDYETTTKQQIKGNIYLAKVTRVEPSLQAAFVEYGGNRHGFLAFSEIHPDYYRIPVGDREELVEDENDDDENGEAGEDGDGVEDVSAGGGVDEAVEEAAKRRPRLRRQYKIQEVIKRRQVMLVQVVKEERGTKGAALTTYLSLAGRYCVVMPNTSRGGGVSRKIANAQDRKRLKTILSDLSVPEGMAVILRTAGAERSKAEVKRDFDYLMRLWDEIREKTLESTAPSLIHEEGSLVKRAIRDVYSKDIEEVLIAGDEGYKVAKAFMKSLIPSHAKKVQPYKDEQGIPLFHRFQVEQQLAQMFEPTVQLRSGGSIVIHQTEALVAIDVNSGKSTRERHIEETAVKTNLEAAEEVARQLRLRDLAGLIVIDFIDMDENRNAHAVERRLKEALRRDRARIQVGRISGFGLLEMSRQRLRPSLIEAMSQPCPTCGGVGYIVSTESAALMVTRAIEEEGLRHRASELTVKLPGSVALYLLNHKRAVLSDMEQRYGFSITIEAVDGMLPPKYEIGRSGQSDQDDTGEARGGRQARDGDEDGGSRRRGRRGGRKRGRGEDRVDQDQDEDVEDQAIEDAEVESGDGESGDGDEDRGSRRRRKRGRRGGRRRGGRDQTEDNGPESEDGDADASDEESTDGETEQKERKSRRRRSRGGRGRGGRPETAEADIETDSETNTETDSAGEDAVDSPEDAGEMDASVTPPAEETDDSPSETDADPAPAKKPRRSRKKAAAAKPAEAAPAEDVVTEEVEPEPEKKPRRSRKKAAAATPEPAPATDAPTDAPQPDPSEEAPEATAEAVPDTPADPEPDAVEEGPPKPKRKGWWNRVIG
jgi:ribonuclease E